MVKKYINVLKINGERQGLGIEKQDIIYSWFNSLLKTIWRLIASKLIFF